MARTPMAHLPQADSTSYLSFENSYDSSRKQMFRDIFRNFSYLIMKMYVVCTHENCFVEEILMSIVKIPLLPPDLAL